VGDAGGGFATCGEVGYVSLRDPAFVFMSSATMRAGKKKKRPKK
jgi:hypothetical protein